MKFALAATAILLSTAACSTMPSSAIEAPSPAVQADTANQPVSDPAAEDRRLLAFLDAAFEGFLARSPQGLTGLGRKEQYDRLNTYTDAYRQEGLALSRRQLAALKTQFDPAKLTAAGRLSYRMFEEEIEQDIAGIPVALAWFPASTNGSPAGSIPVFMINQHRVSSVADAQAYVARLNDVERVMTEITTNMRYQASIGIVPSRFNFAPVRADARRVLAGAPFVAGSDTPVFADFKSKVAKLAIAKRRKTSWSPRRARR